MKFGLMYANAGRFRPVTIGLGAHPCIEDAADSLRGDPDHRDVLPIGSVTINLSLLLSVLFFTRRSDFCVVRQSCGAGGHTPVHESVASSHPIGAWQGTGPLVHAPD